MCECVCVSFYRAQKWLCQAIFTFVLHIIYRSFLLFTLNWRKQSSKSTSKLKPLRFQSYKMDFHVLLQVDLSGPWCVSNPCFPLHMRGTSSENLGIPSICIFIIGMFSKQHLHLGLWTPNSNLCYKNHSTTHARNVQETKTPSIRNSAEGERSLKDWPRVWSPTLQLLCFICQITGISKTCPHRYHTSKSTALESTAVD